MEKKTTFALKRGERKIFLSLKREMRYKPTADYRIHKLVTASGINRTRLYQGFYFLFGTAIHVYLLEQRLAYAKKLLKQTTLPVKAVAIQSGFKSEKYFFRFFKQNTSFTPITYRTRSKNPRS